MISAIPSILYKFFYDFKQTRRIALVTLVIKGIMVLCKFESNSVKIQYYSTKYTKNPKVIVGAITFIRPIKQDKDKGC